MATILKNYFVFFNANKKVDTLISQVQFLAQPALAATFWTRKLSETLAELKHALLK